MCKEKIFVLFLVLVSLVGAKAEKNLASSKKEKQRLYVGVDKCKLCHGSRSRGNQYGRWLEGPHSRAFHTFATVGAKDIAKKKGIEDPREASECREVSRNRFWA